MKRVAYFCVLAICASCRGGVDSPAARAVPSTIAARNTVRPHQPLVRSPEAEQAGLPAVEGREISPEEDTLIRQLEAMYRGTPRETQIRRQLTDPRVDNVRIPSNPEAQRLLDRITTIRAARSDSIRADADRAPKVLPVSIALVDRLPLADTSVSAVILRRPRQLPNDVVLMLPSRANARTLGTALHSLTLARQREGDIPVHEEMLAVHGDTALASWEQNGLRAQATSDLTALARAEPSDLPGIGRVRTMQIQLRSLPRH